MERQLPTIVFDGKINCIFSLDRNVIYQFINALLTKHKCLVPRPQYFYVYGAPKYQMLIVMFISIVCLYFKRGKKNNNQNKQLTNVPVVFTTFNCIPLFLTQLSQNINH